MDDIATKYSFAIGKRIKQIFTESYLYLDDSNNMQESENSSIRRIDEPLFILLENGKLLCLYGTSFTIADDFLREYVFSEKFHPDIKTQQVFQFMCGEKISNVQEYKVFYNYEDKEDNLDEFGELMKSDDVSSMAITLDNGIRLVCEMFFRLLRHLHSMITLNINKCTPFIKRFIPLIICLGGCYFFHDMP